MSADMTMLAAGPSTGGSLDAVPAVEVLGASKRYGGVEALAGVSIRAAAGEFLTLLGPSGSGKTTLLNIIAGFQRPDAGAVRLHGADVTSVPAHRRNIGMVFQSYALFPHMTVAANIDYPLRIRRVPKRERAASVAHYLELVELVEQRDRLPDELSGGQRQRVALARALVFRPNVILMDEPLGALDRRLRQSLQREIARIHQEVQATVIYVTHDQEEALALSTRIAVMKDGRVEQVGGPREVYERPATIFAATFLGETNLLEMQVERVLGAGGNGLEVIAVHRGSGVRLAVEVSQASVADRVTVAIRPEHLEIADGPPMDGHALPARVRSTMFMGERVRVECRCGDCDLAVHVSSDRGQRIAVGDQIFLVPRPAAVCVFHEGRDITARHQ